MAKYIIFLTTFIYSTLLTGQCEDTGNYWNDSWVSCEKSQNPNPIRGESHWLLYEFEGIQVIDSTHFWNANRTGESGWGIKEFVIDYSEDDNSWTELGTFVIPRGPETEDYIGSAGPDLGKLALKRILITVLSTYDNSNCASLAEVQFKVDENGCFGVVDICGVCNGSGELIWYQDADGDGEGDPLISVSACDAPVGYVINNDDLCDNGALGWKDMKTLFSENGCNDCHGNNAAGGLDLRSYATTITGGNICGATLLSGDTFVKTITTSNYDGCGSSLGPAMNQRSSGEFDAMELAVLQKWIDGQAPEACTDFFFLLDEDQDGYYNDVDCDDNNPNINPAQPEEVYNGIDDDCNPTTLDDDLDQDGFLIAEDCDDNNPDINPAQLEEVYNGIDDDCNPATLDDDLDQDGFLLVDDCNDTIPTINPNAVDISNNGIDEDCDGMDLISSVHKIENSTLNIYPNPTIDLINIAVEGQLNYQVGLYDIKGKLIKSSYNSSQIRIDAIPSGTYLLKIMDLKTGKKIVERIIIGK